MRFTLDLWAGEGEALVILILCVLAETYKLGIFFVSLIALARSVCLLIDKLGSSRTGTPIIVRGPPT